jgi:triphosphatase
MSKSWKGSDLSPNEPIIQSLKKVLFYWIGEMTANASETIKGKDTEALHGMQTAALGIRALLKLHREYFPKKALREHRKDLKRLIDSMGPAREIDVFQSELTYPGGIP